MSQSPPDVPHLPPANRRSSGCARALFILIAGFALVAGLAWLMKDKSTEASKKVGNVPISNQGK